jgi:LacI family transcriptional regulator
MVDTLLPHLNIDFIVENNVELSYQLVNHAISKGHKKISIVNGIMGISTAHDRFIGFQKALKMNNIAFEKRYSVDGGYYRDIAYRNVKDMLEENREDLPTLIYATNNQMTEGAMIAIKEMGLSIPEDISIISFGEIILFELVEPRITAILQDSRAIGKKAGEILIERMEKMDFNLSTKTYIIESEFVIRNSVKTLEVE